MSYTAGHYINVPGFVIIMIVTIILVTGYVFFILRAFAVSWRNFYTHEVFFFLCFSFGTLPASVNLLLSMV